MSYYIGVAKGYWENIQQIIFDPSLHDYIKGILNFPDYQTVLDQRRGARLAKYDLTGEQLDQEILALNPNPSDVNPNVQALAQSKYPIDLTVGIPSGVNRPFNPKDVPLLVAPEDERIQYLTDNFVNYNIYFNELIDEIRRFYYVEKRVNIYRILIFSIT